MPMDEEIKAFFQHLEKAGVALTRCRAAVSP
jgi:hypothetical protein